MRAKKRTTKTLDETLYCYVEKGNAKYARSQGTKLFGSYSNYINVLIAKDRGVKPRLGKWQAPFQRAEKG